MRHVRVIIQSEPRLYWQPLASALERDAGYSVRLASLDEIQSLLSDFKPHVLVLDITSRLLEDRVAEDVYRTYINQHPNLVILGLDRESANYLLRMPANLQLSAIVQLIDTATSEVEQRDDANRLLLVTQPQLADLKVSEYQVSQEVNESEATALPDDSMHLPMKWIEISLHLALAPALEDDDQVGTPGWTMAAGDAKQLLSQEFASSSQQELEERRAEIEPELFEHRQACRFSAICVAFELTRLEAQVLLLALAPEIDGRFGKVFGYFNDNLVQFRPSVSLVARLLLDEGANAWDLRKYLAVSNQLLEYGLVSLTMEDRTGGDTDLLPAPEVVAYLLASHDADVAYGDYLTMRPARPGQAQSKSTVYLQRRLAGWLADAKTISVGRPIVQFVGNDASCEWFLSWVEQSNTALVQLELSNLAPDDPDGSRQICQAAIRVARLHGALLFVSGCDEVAAPFSGWFERIFVERSSIKVPCVVLHGKNNWIVKARRPAIFVERQAPRPAERAQIWSDRAALMGKPLPRHAAQAMAEISRFGEPEIDATLRRCESEVLNETNLKESAKGVARAAVPGTVQQVDSVFQWTDIVLPEDVLHRLHTIPGHVRNASVVLDTWGYRQRMPYGHAVTALFSGPSGTGKTMAAQIISNDLGVELFQVDLAKLVSKYIGETEKNLGEVFDAAEKASAVLLFDEADALFGKRTEVRDAHDRYANVEVAYLLQRMESYEGLAILTTNMRQNLDPAFMRRLRFVVEFPPPGPAEREAIWRGVFPRNAPLGPEVDFGFLARKVELTGGNIQQIAIRAGFAAIKDGGRIRMRHIREATSEEFMKLGMQNAEKKLAELAA